jgi:CDP-diglyceride synthetase
MNAGTLFGIAGGLFAFGGALMILGHVTRHAEQLRRHADGIKYAVYVLVIGGLLAALAVSRIVSGVLLALIAVGGARELYGNLRGPVVERAGRSFLFSLLVAASLGHLVLGPWGASLVLLVATCDAFSQLWGRLLGRRLLVPRISPGKTLEGCVGGVLTTVLVAAIAGGILPELPAGRRVLLGAVVAAGATAGDLAFSFLKRRLGIKDFAATLPGHGGLLDRFDSLIVAAPLGTWLLRAMLVP